MRLVIRNEDDAWAVLRQFVSGKLEAEGPPELVFDGWPKYELTVKGQRYKSSITTSLMNAYVHFQRNLNRARALGAHGVSDARHLAEDELEENEVVVSVSDGSTALLADLSPIIQSIASRVSTLSTTEITIIAIIIALSFCSRTLIKKYFKGKESDAEVRKEQQRTAQSQEETERLRVLLETQNKLSNLGLNFNQFGELAIESHATIVDSIQDADSAVLGGVTLSHDELQEVRDPESGEQFPKQITGEFEIKGLRTTYPMEYYLSLRKDEMRIRASFNPTNLNTKTMARLKDAVLHREKIKLSVVLTDRPVKQYIGFVEEFWPK